MLYVLYTFCHTPCDLVQSPLQPSTSLQTVASLSALVGPMYVHHLVGCKVVLSGGRWVALMHNAYPGGTEVV